MLTFKIDSCHLPTFILLLSVVSCLFSFLCFYAKRELVRIHNSECKYQLYVPAKLNKRIKKHVFVPLAAFVVPAGVRIHLSNKQKSQIE